MLEARALVLSLPKSVLERREFSGRPASESFVEQFFSRPCGRQGSLLISSRQQPVYILVGTSCLITAEVRKCLIPVRRTFNRETDHGWVVLVLRAKGILLTHAVPKVHHGNGSHSRSGRTRGWRERVCYPNGSLCPSIGRYCRPAVLASRTVANARALADTTSGPLP